MSDKKTWGQKVPEELYKDLSDLQSKLGLSGESFLNDMLTVYKTEKARDEIPEVAQDFKELSILTNRIYNIYLNLGYRINTLSEQSEKEKQELLNKKDEIILNLQNKSNELQVKNDTLVNAYNDVVNNENALNNRINELTDSNNNFKILNKEYKSKIDTMAGIVEEYKDSKAENDTLKSQLREAQNELKLKKNQLATKTDDNEKLNQMIIQERKEREEEITSLKEKNKQIIVELENKHKEELKNAKDNGIFEKDKAMLELKSKHQEEMLNIQNKHNVEIEEYQDKFKDLLSEIENFKKISSKEVKTKNQNNK